MSAELDGQDAATLSRMDVEFDMDDLSQGELSELARSVAMEDQLRQEVVQELPPPVLDDQQEFTNLVAGCTTPETMSYESGGMSPTRPGERCWANLLGHECHRDSQSTGEKLIDKFCSVCRATGVCTAAARVRALRPEQREHFANSRKEGFWTEGGAGTPRFRVVNHTKECSGPWLVLFETDPSGLPVEWLELPPDWLETPTHVRLWLSKSTMVPRQPRQKLKRARTGGAPAGAGGVAPIPPPALRVGGGGGLGSGSASSTGSPEYVGAALVPQSQLLLQELMGGSAPEAAPGTAEYAAELEADFVRQYRAAHDVVRGLIEARLARTELPLVRPRLEPQACGSAPTLLTLTRSGPHTASQAAEQREALTEQLRLSSAVVLGGIAEAAAAHPALLPPVHLPPVAAAAAAPQYGGVCPPCGGGAAGYSYAAGPMQGPMLQSAELPTWRSSVPSQATEQVRRASRLLQGLLQSATFTANGGALGSSLGTPLVHQSSTSSAGERVGDVKLHSERSDVGAALGSVSALLQEWREAAPDAKQPLSFRALTDAAERSAARRGSLAGAPEAATLSPRRTSLGSTLETLGLTGGETEYSGPSRHVNRQLRHALLRQQPLSNRFDGSALASRAERAYRDFVTTYQLQKVVWRLLKLACLLPPISLCHGPPDPSSPSRVALFVCRTILPSLVLLGAAALCRWPRTAPRWRAIVMAACVLAYACLAAADLCIEYDHWTVKAKDFQTMWQLIWLLMVFVCSWTLFALDLVEVAVVLCAQWLLYLCSTLGAYYKWWDESLQGPSVYHFAPTQIEDDSSSMDQLSQECTYAEARLKPWASRLGRAPSANPATGPLCRDRWMSLVEERRAERDFGPGASNASAAAAAPPPGAPEAASGSYLLPDAGSGTPLESELVDRARSTRGHGFDESLVPGAPRQKRGSR